MGPRRLGLPTRRLRVAVGIAGQQARWDRPAAGDGRNQAAGDGRNQESAKASVATFGLTGQPSRIGPKARKYTLMKTITTLVAALPTATAAVVLIAGCSNHDTAPPAPFPSVQASPSPSAAPSVPPASSQAPSAPPTVTVTVTPTASPAPSQSPSAPAALGPCSDSDLEVTNGPLESANTQRHAVVSFRNTSSHPCTLIGYPGADLVTPAGGVLIHVSRRPAAAAHHLTLNPGDVATADVQAYAIDTSTGNPCPRWGNLVVTPPNDYASHPLSVDLPICNATVSSVD